MAFRTDVNSRPCALANEGSLREREARIAFLASSSSSFCPNPPKIECAPEFNRRSVSESAHSGAILEIYLAKTCWNECDEQSGAWPWYLTPSWEALHAMGDYCTNNYWWQCIEYYSPNGTVKSTSKLTIVCNIFHVRLFVFILSLIGFTIIRMHSLYSYIFV